MPFLNVAFNRCALMLHFIRTYPALMDDLLGNLKIGSDLANV